MPLRRAVQAEPRKAGAEGSTTADRGPTAAFGARVSSSTGFDEQHPPLTQHFADGHERHERLTLRSRRRHAVLVGVAFASALIWAATHLHAALGFLFLSMLGDALVQVRAASLREKLGTDSSCTRSAW